MKSIPRSLLPKKRAFTLIELIMAIVIAGILAIPISVTLSKQVQSVFDSQDLALAANLARLDLEQMNNTAYAGIVPATLNNYQGYNYNLIRAVSFVNGAALTAESTVKVTVKVTKPGNPAVLVKLVTYVSKNVRYPPF